MPPVQVGPFRPHFLKPLGGGVGRPVLGFPINIGDHVREVPTHQQGLQNADLCGSGCRMTAHTSGWLAHTSGGSIGSAGPPSIAKLRDISHRSHQP
jgi:hypothetical protein